MNSADIRLAAILDLIARKDPGNEVEWSQYLVIISDQSNVSLFSTWRIVVDWLVTCEQALFYWDLREARNASFEPSAEREDNPRALKQESLLAVRSQANWLAPNCLATISLDDWWRIIATIKMAPGNKGYSLTPASWSVIQD